jgi:hypothetical protein
MMAGFDDRLLNYRGRRKQKLFKRTFIGLALARGLLEFSLRA